MDELYCQICGLEPCNCADELPYTADLSQTIEQAESTLMEMARAQGSFFTALIAAGFTRDEAFILVQDYLRIVWSSAADGGLNASS